jgi:hypothetical protein
MSHPSSLSADPSQQWLAPTCNGKPNVVWLSLLNVLQTPPLSPRFRKNHTLPSVVRITYFLLGSFKCGRASIPQLAYENADTSLTLHPRYLLDVTDQDESKMRNFTINFGPQHPAAHVTSRSSISLSNESKVHLKLTNSSNFYRVC